MENDSSQFSNDPAEPPAPWFQVPRAFIRNPKLSFESKGLMTYLMSHSGDWHISIPYIIKTQNISKNIIYRIINECIENGYLKRELYLEKGMKRFKYLVSPTGRFKKCLPCPENQDPEKQDPENQDSKLNQSSSSEEEKGYQLEEHSLSCSLSQKKSEVKEESVCFGTHVKLKKEDYENFCSEYGKQNIDSLIEEMNDWITSRGKNYKDYAAELRNWIRRRNWTKASRESVEAKPIEPTPKKTYTDPKQKLIEENRLWANKFMIGKNADYLRTSRAFFRDNFFEFPEVPEGKFYYDSPGFRSCMQTVLEELILRDFTNKAGAPLCG